MAAASRRVCAQAAAAIASRLVNAGQRLVQRQAQSAREGQTDTLAGEGAGPHRHRQADRARPDRCRAYLFHHRRQGFGMARSIACQRCARTASSSHNATEQAPRQVSTARMFTGLNPAGVVEGRRAARGCKLLAVAIAEIAEEIGSDRGAGEEFYRAPSRSKPDVGPQSSPRARAAMIR